MIFLDKPYVSDFLLQTIEDNQLPVVCTDYAKAVIKGRNIKLINKSDVITRAKSNENLPFLMTSENSIGWVAENLSFLELSEKIDFFKDKAKFRKLTAGLHPDIFYTTVDISDLDEYDISVLPLPFVIKPSVGFFSMGVHIVTDLSQWGETKAKIYAEVAQTKNLYPLQVFDSHTFIIEQIIMGEEFAFDAYFDDEGKPVILSIFKHLFSSQDDVSDRVYITSKDIIEKNIEAFTSYLDSIGKLCDLKNFPVHVEVRCDAQGVIRPIEINPLRFGGWCSTADMTAYAYGLNPYLAFFKREKPDWSALLRGKKDISYAIIVLDNSTGVDGQKINNFDYVALASKFKTVLNVRRIDYQEYPVFGFLFVETKQEDFSELENILISTLSDYITV